MAAPALAQTPGEKILFDGRNLDAWTPVGDANWQLVEGVVQAGKGLGHLVSKETFENFHLRVEMWIDPLANSGVFFRNTDAAAPTPQNAYEVNVYDARADPSGGTGSLAGVATVNPMPRAAGKWSVVEIRAQGDRFDVWVNGVQSVTDAHDSKWTKGRITLQMAAGPSPAPGGVKFRKVSIRPL